MSSTEIERIISHVGDGLDRLLTQYKGRPRLKGWASAYLRQVQVLEDAAYDVLIARMIDNAIGVQLDVIGRIVGEFRSGRVDTVYRRFLRARIRINRSQGNTQDVLDVLAIITSTPLFFTEYQPACLYIALSQIADEDPVLLYSMLRDTKAGGVKLVFIVPTTNTLQALPRSVGYALDGTDGDASAFVSGSAGFSAAGATFPAGIVGGTLTISGSADPLNDGAFPILARTSPTQLFYNNPDATDDANDGALVWSIAKGIFDTNDPTHAVGDGRSSATGTVTISPAQLIDVGKFDGSEAGKIVVVTRKDAQPEFVGIRVVVGSYVDADTLNVPWPPGFYGGDPTFEYYIENRSFGLLSDAVTLRDPHAPPPIPRPGPPRVLFLTPNFGPDAEVTSVTIEGENFNDLLTVHLGPTNGPTNVTDLVRVDSDTLTCKLPVHDLLLPRSATLWVTSVRGPGYKLSAFVYQAPPVFSVTSVTPGTGQLGDTFVIEGGKFTDVVGVDLEIAGDYTEQFDYTIDDDSTISLTVASAGLYTPYGVRVRHLTDGAILYRGGVSFPPAIMFFPPPSCNVDQSLTTQTGTSIMGGWIVHVGGTLLSELVDFSYDYLSSIGAGTFIDDEHIDMTAAPADDVFHDLSDGIEQDMTVGYYNSGGPPIGDFLVHYDPLRVDLIAPNETPAAGGETITLTGTSLDATEPYDGVGPTSGLMVDGVPTDFTIVDEHTITFVAPAGTIATTVTVALTGIVGLNSGVPIGTSSTNLTYG